MRKASRLRHLPGSMLTNKRATVIKIPLFENSGVSKIEMVVKVLKKKIGTWARFVFRSPPVLADGLYDLHRYLSHSSAVDFRGPAPEKMQAIIIRYSHNIEKGLSLPAPRPLFGESHLNNLLRYCRLYVAAHGEDEITDMAHDVLRTYVEFHEERGAAGPVLDVLREYLAQMREPTLPKTGGVTPRDVFAGDREQLLAFFHSRRSVRNYIDEPVPVPLLMEAARAAASAPAVCNRQFGRVWYSHDREIINRMLEIQGGARGFQETIPTILMVTTDLSAYVGNERYQGWIDGGLFCMNLVLGLHAQGVSSCCLNWSKTRHEDREMRALVPIPESESIIMLIAAGYAAPEAVVPMSTRRPSEYFLSEIQL